MSSFAPPPQGQPHGQPHQPQYQVPQGQPYQQPMAPHPGPQVPAPVKRKRHWKAPTFIGIGAFVLGILIGGAGGGDGAPSAEPAPTVTVDGEAPPVTESQEYKDLAAERDALQAQVDKAAAAEAEVAANGITEGTWTVGTDIEPGTYKVTEPVTDCYWSITTTGSNGDIVDNDIVTGGLPQVTLSEGTDFTSNRCGTWAKIG